MPKILYVEDHVDIREITTCLLAGAGYSVTPASNGFEALEIFRNRKFDLIITDIFMPIMDGNQLISELAQYSDLPPILVLSYNPFDINPSSVITLTAVKPMKIIEFRQIVYKAIYANKLDLTRSGFVS